MRINKTIYSSEKKNRNPISIISSMLIGIKSSFYVSYRLFKKELKGKIAKAKFGIIWDFLEPLSLAITFLVLHELGIIHGGQSHLSYVTFVIYGLMLYQLFNDAVMSSLAIIIKQKTLITHQAVMPEALLLGNLFYSLFDCSIKLSILFIVTYYQKEINFLGFFIVILLTPSVILAGMSFGIFLAPFNVLYNDIGRFTGIILTALRFSTPVVWAFPHEKYATMYIINPMATFIDSLRTLGTIGKFPYMYHFFNMLGLCLCIFFIGWYIFHVAIIVIAERA